MGRRGSASRRHDPSGAPPPLVWPRPLVREDTVPAIVYLDLNHWIGLAKAAIGHPDGARYAEVLTLTRRAAQSGQAIFVLSSAHYFELAQISDPRQRADIAVVIEELTGFTTIPSRAIVARIEIRAMVDDLRKITRARHSPALLGYGVGHALGYVIEFRARDSNGRDVTKSIRKEVGPAEFDTAFDASYHNLEQSMVSGPTDPEVLALRQHGWSPESIFEVTEGRLQQEVEQAARLDTDDRWRRGRLRDLVSVREYIIELRDLLLRDLSSRGLFESDVIQPQRVALRKFVRGMPSTEVSVELKTAMHRDPHHRWSINDIHDIDAMAVAVPYCDIVFTDAAVRNLIVAAHLDKRMHAQMPRRIEDFLLALEHLNRGASARHPTQDRKDEPPSRKHISYLTE